MRRTLLTPTSFLETTCAAIILVIILFPKHSTAAPPQALGNHGSRPVFGPERLGNGNHQQEDQYPTNTPVLYPSSTPRPSRRDGRPPDNTPRYGPSSPLYRVNKERAEAVKQAYQTSWDAYYKYAFPRDSLRPVRGEGFDDRFVFYIILL